MRLRLRLRRRARGRARGRVRTDLAARRSPVTITLTLTLSLALTHLRLVAVDAVLGAQLCGRAQPVEAAEAVGGEGAQEAAARLAGDVGEMYRGGR